MCQTDPKYLIFKNNVAQVVANPEMKNEVKQTKHSDTLHIKD